RSRADTERPGVRSPRLEASRVETSLAFAWLRCRFESPDSFRSELSRATRPSAPVLSGAASGCGRISGDPRESGGVRSGSAPGALPASKPSPRTTSMATDSEGSVTRMIGALLGGETDHAAEQLWRHYFEKLVRLAQARLKAAPRGVADEEDIALSAFDS